MANTHRPDAARTETAVFAGGCFWCVEAVFESVEGVLAARSGYAGGHVPNPTYEQVCTGTTGHAEAVEVTYDPSKVSYADLLEVFWNSHDPTTPNRQGPDVGTQYRSAIFYRTQEQRRMAEESKRRLEEAGVFGAPIVTEIVALEAFYPAEEYHQDFFARNPGHPYCRMVIAPKMEKVRAALRGLVRPAQRE